MNQKGKTVEQTLQVIEKLIARDLDVTELMTTKKVEGKKVWIKLGEIPEAKDLIESGEYSKDFPIGVRIDGIRQALKGQGHYVVTPEQAQKAKELGLLKRKERPETATDKLLNLVELLVNSGADFTNIPYSKSNGKEQISITLQDIPGAETVIEEYGLDRNFPIGRRIYALRTAAKGKLDLQLTEEQLLKAKKLGLLEKREHTAVLEETLRIIELLTQSGIDCSKIKLSYMEKKKQVYIKLGQIPGADNIIKENNLDADYPIGRRINNLKEAARGKIRCIITEEQKKRTRELGILVDDRETAIAETIRIATILIQNGIDLSAMQLSRKENGNKIFLKLGELPGLDKIIKENELDKDFPIGRRISILRQAVKGMVKYKITSDEIETAQKLGLITTRLEKKSKQKQEVEKRKRKAERLYKEYEKLDLDKSGRKNKGEI